MKNPAWMAGFFFANYPKALLTCGRRKNRPTSHRSFCLRSQVDILVLCKQGQFIPFLFEVDGKRGFSITISVPEKLFVLATGQETGSL